LLRRGWTRLLKMYGKEIDLDRYQELPLKGDVPAAASPEDAESFGRFAKDRLEKDSGMIKFTVPVDFGGRKHPIFIYVVTGRNGYAELQDQFQWWKEIRGGVVPQEVQDSFKRLHDIAVENNVSYPDLCVYALGTAAAEENAQKLFDTAIESLKKCEAQYSEDKSDSNRSELVAAYSSAADRALYLKRWADAAKWARKSLELADFNPTAHGNLATALLFQDKYEQALEIYKAHWRDEMNGKTLGDCVLIEFDALEKAGSKHPDVARIKEAMGVKPDAPAGGDKKPDGDTKP
jgi:tetratricopeptide (TPR) repeat protein